MASTRQRTPCPVFEEAKEHCRSSLPAYEQKMKHFLFLKLQLETTTYNPLSHATFKCVTTYLLEVWQKSSISSHAPNRMIAILRDYHGKYVNILKTQSSIKIKNDAFNKKLYDFKQK